MSQNIRKAGFVVGVLLAGLFVGAVAGFFAGHHVMSDMAGTKDSPEVKEPVMESMKGMDDMPGMSGDSSAAVAVPAVARQLIGIRSTPVVQATLEEEIRTVGTVGYDERSLTQVTLKISGWVRKVFVDSIGRPVRKGEPLFTFYSPDLMATQDEYLLALKTKAQLAESPLDEAKANADALVASARERLRLWDVTDAQIAALGQRGKAEPLITIYAPSSGIVMKRDALPGKYAEPGTTLYEIADLSRVWISADIFESEMALTKAGQPASITFAAYPGETFSGRVAYVYPTLNTEARTVRVRLELPNPDLKLKPGMYGNVMLKTNVARALVVPKEAVVNTGIRQLVFMDRGQGRYEPVSVKLGRRGQDTVEVMEGLQEGDRIVTSANFLLDAESKLVSASNMQSMMGRIGMGDWQMKGAYEAKMEGMEGMSGMQGMDGMKGMKEMSGMSEMGSGSAKTISETRKVAGHVLTFTTLPEMPKAGDVLLKLRVTSQSGKPVTNAQVLFVYTMPMPGMTDSKVTGRHTKDGLYEGKVMFGMGGTWVVTTNVSIPGQPPVLENFEFLVAGSGM